MSRNLEINEILKLIFKHIKSTNLQGMKPLIFFYIEKLGKYLCR